ncbi:MAG TPA: metalloregulator ArsR/SmtB family transcription factor [Longimicrobiales bacterium]|nr:metalloregulator ArsR/SmtB family transcription factor [Longimicrobiales bacterium]
MTRDPTKRRLFEQFAQVGKALSSPARLELIDLLAQGEKPVELLAGQAGLSVTNASNHLRALREAGLVDTRREGQFIFYRLASTAVSDFLRSLQALAHERSATVRELVTRYLQEPDTFEPVRAEELAERMRADDTVVIDVRPHDEYASGHIPGALSVPIDEIEARVGDLAALAEDGEIVAYCRGRYCVYASRAVEILRAHGLRATRLAEGIPEWRSMGLRVAVGANPPNDNGA